uniref:Uncharacterized protein n=1 Tax=Rhizophora mucronata TaxID=61149 RepID=A0A2P2P9N6_RHIMU
MCCVVYLMYWPLIFLNNKYFMLLLSSSNMVNKFCILIDALCGEVLNFFYTGNISFINLSSCLPMMHCDCVKTMNEVIPKS